MRIAQIAFVALASTIWARAEPIGPNDEIQGVESAFHHMLHDARDFYLVCVYEVTRHPPPEESWPADVLKIKATIVEVLKGNKKVGDKIEIGSMVEGELDLKSMKGALRFVPYTFNDHTPDTPGYVPGRLPDYMFRYSEELHKLARKHE